MRKEKNTSEIANLGCPITALLNMRLCRLGALLMVVLGAKFTQVIEGRALMGLKTALSGTFGPMLRRVLVVPVATVLASTALVTTAHAALSRWSDGYIDFQMMDSTVLGPNKRCSEHVLVYNNPGYAPGHFWYFTRCGGLRAEFHYSISRDPDGTIVMRDADAYLYEGGAPGTGDEVDHKSYFWSVLQEPDWRIPRLGHDTKYFHVANYPEGDPDDEKADMTFVYVNWG
ncbi:hypothetical protein ACIQB5_35560 [Streptomyces sp. NPDC088560]|uniref:hypothetical protein n=1 Tax=Streptomyces sp. NPDC088560 TaxID=3365868 RepID=UPI0038135495